MHFSQSIDRHKADIEKRISQLQNKLKAPHLNLYPPSQQNYKQQYRSPQPYIEPKEVSSIRNALLQRNVKESRNYLEKSQNRYPQEYSYHQKHQEYQPRKKQSLGNTSFQGEGRITKNITNYTEQQNYKNPQSKDEIYEMMSMILKGQKNLEKEITQLKSEWSKDQSIRQINEQKVQEQRQERRDLKKQSRRDERIFSSQSYNQKNSFNQGESQISDYQVGEVRNLRRETIDVNKKYSNPSKEDEISLRKNINVNKKLTIKDDTLNGSDLNIQNKGVSKQKIVKKNTKKQAILDIATLVQNQKSRNDRLVVDEEKKNEFWRCVETRIRESQTQYKDAVHRNIKHEHEHLVYTNELQKKLKQDLVSKIYSQCNRCIYK